ASHGAHGIRHGCRFGRWRHRLERRPFLGVAWCRLLSVDCRRQLFYLGCASAALATSKTVGSANARMMWTALGSLDVRDSASASGVPNHRPLEDYMTRRESIVSAFAVLFAASAAAQQQPAPATSARICLAPPDVQAPAGSGDNAVAAVRQS